MNSQRIASLSTALELPAFRVRQLQQAFFVQHVPDYDGVTTLPKPLRERLAAKWPSMTVNLVDVRSSADGRARKALLELHDGQRVETVLLNPKPGLWSCCISSEVGCSFGCRFCATGSMGFVRRLRNEEITDQVLFWQQYLQQEMPDVRLRNVVYMGMGEPLHNAEAVFDSLDELMNPDTFGFGARHLSLSTVGVVSAMEEFTTRFPQVNLAVSLHAASDALRSRLVPVNRKYPLKQLGKAVEYHLRHTHRKVFLEYVLLGGVNDADPHAHRLADFIHMFTRPGLLHVNLIPWHTTGTGSPYQVPPRNRVRVFLTILLGRGVKATIRKSLGSDIAGACGQLAVRTGPS